MWAASSSTAQAVAEHPCPDPKSQPGHAFHQVVIRKVSMMAPENCVGQVWLVRILSVTSYPFSRGVCVVCNCFGGC